MYLANQSSIRSYIHLIIKSFRYPTYNFIYLVIQSFFTSLSASSFASYICCVFRPVLIVGPLADAVVNKLVSDRPHSFVRLGFIQSFVLLVFAKCFVQFCL